VKHGRVVAVAVALVTASCGALLGTDEDADPPRGSDAATSPSDAPLGEDSSLASDSEADAASSETGADVFDAGGRIGCLGDAACQRYVFVTSDTFPVFGGLTQGDDICQLVADRFGSNATLKNRSWRAWLSDEQTNASDHLVQGSAPYRLVDGTVVAITFYTLTHSSTLAHAIDVDETASVVGGPVWTGTDNTGNRVSGVTCNGWTSTSGNGKVGAADATTSAWTGASDLGCDQRAHLYCFEY